MSTIQLPAVLQTALTNDGLISEALLHSVQIIHSVPDSLVSSVMVYNSIFQS